MELDLSPDFVDTAYLFIYLMGDWFLYLAYLLVFLSIVYTVSVAVELLLSRR